MKNNIITTSDYSINQLILPLDLSVKISKTDPVCTFNELVNNLNLNKYLNKKSIYYAGRKGYNTKVLLKLILFGYMIGRRTLRELEDSCKNDIRFMWLGNRVKPSHQTFGTFINDYLLDSIENIFYDLNKLIIKKENIKLDTLFIDGTKIEANANKNTFVWKKASLTFKKKMIPNIKKLIHDINYNLFFFQNVMYQTSDEPTIEELNIIRDDLLKEKQKQNVVFKTGKGVRKTKLQKYVEKISYYIDRLNCYQENTKICGKHRNSYSKTDHDATFMRIKIDYMGNDQLLPGYNMQVGVFNEYIMLADVYQFASDYSTYRLLMELFNSKYGYYLKRPVCDAGYGGYSNFIYNKEHGIELYQKYPMFKYDVKKKNEEKKFLVENFKCVNGTLFCPNNRKLVFSHKVQVRNCDYDRKSEIYKVSNCRRCPFQEKCKPNNFIKKFNLNSEKTVFHNEAIKNLTSPLGIELRKQRSIQAEGVFGVIKYDSDYNRIKRRGMKKVKMEWLLVSIGYNLLKFHRKKYRLSRN